MGVFMNVTRLATISYAEGFVEDFIEGYINDIDEETAEARTLEQATQLQNMWQVLITGLQELRRENAALELKVHTARIALL